MLDALEGGVITRQYTVTVAGSSWGLRKARDG